MRRIICIGNLFIPADAAGYLVFATLQQRKIPQHVEVCDGGIAGLDLLRLIEGAERIVFVDRVSGFASPGEVVVLQANAVAALADRSCGHATGLPYLLRVLPDVCEGDLPWISIVGVEGPCAQGSIDRAAELALRLINAQDADDRPWNDAAVCRGVSG